MCEAEILGRSSSVAANKIHCVQGQSHIKRFVCLIAIMSTITEEAMFSSYPYAELNCIPSIQS